MTSCVIDVRVLRLCRQPTLFNAIVLVLARWRIKDFVRQRRQYIAHRRGANTAPFAEIGLWLRPYVHRLNCFNGNETTGASC
jgi:hypothetical protein